MNLFSTLLLALAMSTDAFAAAVAQGAALHRPRFREALRIGLIFGVIEAITPLVGWAIGHVAVAYVRQWDHWIAFGLLGGLGLMMIKEGFETPQLVAQRSSRHSFWRLATTGLATSLDAMAVGVGLAFAKVDIVRTAIAIGLATLVMVTLGVMIGRLLGAVVGKRAEVFGGLVLIGIGSLILYEHLNGAG